MLTKEDKQWIEKRFAEQEKRIDARFSTMMDIMDRRFIEFRKEYQSDFGAMMRKIDDRLDKMLEEMKHINESLMDQAAENTHQINFLIDSKIMPKVDAMLELVPYAGASYEKLEQRVSDLNFKYEVLAVKTETKIPER